MSATVGGMALPPRTFKTRGDHEAIWPIDVAACAKLRVAAGSSGNVSVEIESAPPYRLPDGDDRMRGVGVVEIGFR